MVVNGLEYKNAHMRAKDGFGFFFTDARPYPQERIKLELPTPRGTRVFDIGSVSEIHKTGGRWLVKARLKPRLRGLML
ncbi:hypothetical protein YT28_03165 [Salmonella enterica subsp. salamae]|nr:hypothetical protein [Salmonella enterica subsp. salamae]EDW4470759.1 hypothetical protein [Salmonella enterica subsp. salamae]